MTRAFDESPESAIAELRAELEDKYSTLLERSSRLPTGTMLPTAAAVAPPNTLLLQGQTVTRAAYPNLWKWAVDHGSVVTGLFGPGNGTTTFTLPDARDRFLVGAGGTVTLGGTGGAATHTLSVANLPAHDHNVSVDSAGSHGHGGSTGASGGNHGNHNQGDTIGGIASTGGPWSITTNAFLGNSGHSHGLSIDDAGSHTHGITESTVGSGTAVDQRPPFLAVNVLIYT